MKNQGFILAAAAAALFTSGVYAATNDSSNTVTKVAHSSCKCQNSCKGHNKCKTTSCKKKSLQKP